MLLSKFKFFLPLVLIIGVLVSFNYPLAAQTLDPAREAQLKAELQQVLQEIEAQQKVLDAERAKGVSLQRDISILDAQIKQAQLKIQAHNLAIAALGKDITAKTATINTLTGKISQNKESLAQLLRKTNEMDEYSLSEAVLSNETISEFFDDINDLDSVKEAIQNTIGVIKKSKEDTEAAKQTLDKKRLQEINERISVQDEQAKIKKDEAEKKRLLSLSKAQQASYSSDLAKKQARAASIRAALFSLRDTASIPFGDALNYATKAQQSTGVRPAFLLAILTQESNLGKNVGTCNRPGDPVNKQWQAIMKPTRDQAPYLRIVAALGLTPESMPLSCPLSSGGYGGAMGPAQFIPSTWELFQSRIGAAVGKSVPSPWDPQDAFMAAAIYLGDLGAGAGTYTAERNAACRYYSGRSCDSKKPANSFYGDSVMSLTNKIQTTMIDPLNGL